MRIVVTGSNGQVACSLRELAAREPDIELVTLGRPQLDLLDPASVAAAIGAARPDLVVSAAAYTAVDKAEDEPELAFAANERGAGAVARAARAAGAPVIHLSTDYVFSGETDRPYDENMATGPVSVYGRSKLAGEQAVAAANPDHLVLRTAWVYGPFGRNFLKTMLALAEGRDRISVVDDQFGNPTSSLDIAAAVLAIAREWSKGAPRATGVYHFAGSGETSWCGFARHIFETSAGLGGPSASVDAITTADYPTRAVRPRNSRLDCSKFARDFGFAAPHWRESSRQVLSRLLEAAPGD